MTREPHADEADQLTEDEDFESLLRKVAHVEGSPAGVPLPRPGSIVGDKYRLVAQIGRGGMGAVFSAVHMVSEKPVAVKWTLRSTSDERTRERFLREARAAGRCQHPNVVDVYDVGESGQCGYLIMELLHGETLRERLKRGPFELDQAIELLTPAMRGVAAVHQAGVIHRDLKPENIFLCRGPDGAPQGAKVLDFGISAMAEFDPHSPTLTSDGTVAGTPAYMAPERFEHAGNIDERTDVYSLGVILYEMLSGQLPFEANTYPAMILAVTRDTPKPPSSLRPSLPPQFDRVVLRAIAKVPEWRYPTVQALIDALAPFAGAQQKPFAARPPHWLGRVIGLTFALSAVALLGWLGLRGVTSSESSQSLAKPAEPNAASGFEARPPYLDGPECKSCLQTHCRDNLTACDADQDCSTIVARARGSSRPLIADRGYLELLFDYRWRVDHEPARAKSVRENLTKCARQQCAAGCGIGRNFSCVDQFDWPASYPERSSLRLRLAPQEARGPSLAGWRARACALGTNCEPVMGSATTDGAGFATLALDFSKARPNARQLFEFDGWIELDGGPDFYPQLARQSIPLLDRFYKRMAISGREPMRISHSPRGLPLPDEAHGLLQIQALDCEMWGAWGLMLEIWKYSLTGYRPCTDCVIAYPDEGGVPDATLKEFKAWNLAEAEIALPPQDFTLILRDTQTRRLVSAMTHVEVRAGAAMAIVMAPSSKQQIAALPREMLQGQPIAEDATAE